MGDLVEAFGNIGVEDILLTKGLFANLQYTLYLS